MADFRRAAIGFEGGQVLSLRLSDEQLSTLKQSLQGDREGWLEIEAADGAVLISADDVCYLRVESDEHRIGF